jgi:hypothetical protein
MRRLLAAVLAIHAIMAFGGSWAIKSARGVDGIRRAGMLDPLSLEIRIAQMESLYIFYRQKPDKKFLEEGYFIARDAAQLFPGSFQAVLTQASAGVFALAHGVAVPRGEVWAAIQEAMRRDPISINAREVAMFYLAANREDLPRFKEIGVERARLTTAPVLMLCPLCGKHWLEHRHP